MTTYGEWHTVTVLVDGENEGGTPCLHYELAHVDSCAPPAPPEPPAIWPDARCHLEHIIWESSAYPDLYGIPTEAGTYRIRAWYSPAEWGGSYCSDPEDGIEIDDEEAAVDG
ncbi:hypothetical protein [Nocardia fluminea]|uniref:hypothetical protein n=1 Tax=Nocardia fluminea TaxID=134984 RepID=UPI00366903EA